MDEIGGPRKPERFTQQQTRLVILHHDNCTVMFDMCQNQLLAAAAAKKKGSAVPPPQQVTYLQKRWMHTGKQPASASTPDHLLLFLLLSFVVFH